MSDKEKPDEEAGREEDNTNKTAAESAKAADDNAGDNAGEEALEFTPVLPLRDVVVFPRLVMPLFVARRSSLRALEMAAKTGGRVFLVTQKTPATEEPQGDELYDVGCVANVLQTLSLQEGTSKILVEGTDRRRAAYHKQDGVLVARLSPVDDTVEASEELAAAGVRALKTHLKAFSQIGRKSGADVMARIEGVEELPKLLDLVCSVFPMPIKKRQAFLEMTDILRRTQKLIALIESETEVQQIDRKIRGRVKDQIEKNQREYYLQEQARAIHRELGDDQAAETDDLKKRVKNAGMSKQAREKCEQELRKLSMMSPMSAEANVIRSYVDIIAGLPWKKRTLASKTADEAQAVLDADHHGLEKVKERILEYLAVQKRTANKKTPGKAPVLCLVGPPGVGKTSLGRSIAAATGRVFARISLGGVRDEAEIRGHRRTYVGSMPGKIITAMTKSGVKNPLILLDEIDKLGADWRGDPTSALLEVLDPEQNKNFADHYVEVDYDLSEVLFVTTANTMNIPPPLTDRLEIIRLSGYTEEEKINIARRHLIARQRAENGVREDEAGIRTSALRDIVRYYTREAGVRDLERAVSKILRKIVLESDRRETAKTGDNKAKAESENAKAESSKAESVKAESGDDKTEAEDKAAAITITPGKLKKYLGVQKYRYGIAADNNKIGQVTGLAWTAAGGDLLSVEACAFPGKGKILRTGKLGEVMRESIEAAFSTVRARAASYNLNANFARTTDFHIHLPEGAISKDGPSAGIAIATALLSVLSEAPVRCDTAMTGEITLRGEVLPIGGVKEKLLAAARGGIRHVILPKENEKDLADIPAAVKSKFDIRLVKWIDEVFALALDKPQRKKRSAEAAPPANKRQPNKRQGLITH
ncbi:MAG: endopeptidase La [Gammaproteobacteria bacterium]